MMMANQRTSLHYGALLFAFLFLFADMSGMVLAQEPQVDELPEGEAPILIEGLPPLYCGDELRGRLAQ